MRLDKTEEENPSENIQEEKIIIKNPWITRDRNLCRKN